MEKDLYYVELYEIYRGLLTERQREIFSSYYLFDLSLSEIAEPEGFSRQSVYDAVKKVKSKLDGYERVLKLKEKKDDLLSLSEGVEDKELSERIKEIIGN